MQYDADAYRQVIGTDQRALREHHYDVLHLQAAGYTCRRVPFSGYSAKKCAPATLHLVGIAI